jgi:hypothetical protein
MSLNPQVLVTCAIRFFANDVPFLYNGLCSFTRGLAYVRDFCSRQSCVKSDDRYSQVRWANHVCVANRRTFETWWMINQVRPSSHERAVSGCVPHPRIVFEKDLAVFSAEPPDVVR